jgi:antitoxin CptB
MAEDMERRRRRAAWRASHRGTKELDLLIGSFAERRLPLMSEEELAHFERFLEVGDPSLQAWLLGAGVEPEPGFVTLVAAVREFHGLD